MTAYVSIWQEEAFSMFDPVSGTTTIKVPHSRPTDSARYLTLEQRRERLEKVRKMAADLAVPSFLLDERERDAAHDARIRAEKLRKDTTQLIIEKLSPKIASFPTTAPPVTGGWYAPPAAIYNDDPDLRTVNHPCKLVYEAEKLRQEERNTSMYTHESRRLAANQLLEEKNQRDADEIIARTKAFGEDTYADATIFRITRQFYIGGSNKLEKPTVWSSLRNTDDSGNTTWSDDQGRSRTWSDLVSWLVTVGKPVSLDEIETFPPAKFPVESGTVVETTISGTVQ